MLRAHDPIVNQRRVEPSVVTHHGLTGEDAELIVVLAACLHDTGIRCTGIIMSVTACL